MGSDVFGKVGEPQCMWLVRSRHVSKSAMARGVFGGGGLRLPPPLHLTEGEFFVIKFNVKIVMLDFEHFM